MTYPPHPHVCKKKTVLIVTIVTRGRNFCAPTGP